MTTAQDAARTRVKICGLTRGQDIDAAVQAGADAIGLVFYPHSKRTVSLELARDLRRSVPALVSIVALFVNPTEQQVQAVLDHVSPDLLQFHGDESPAFCASFGRRYMRAFRVGGPGLANAEQVLAACRRFGDASAWLFDSHSAGYGGSGLALDVALLAHVLTAPDARPLVLAGGLTPENVRQAISQVRPYAVDVSSGVEDMPGIKSASKIAAFLEAVRR